MHGHTVDLMSCLIRREGVRPKKMEDITPMHLVDRWYGRRGICREDKIKFIDDVKWNCLGSLFFWYKENCIEEIDDLVDF